jgi:branched-chain amino acid transport system ATP-binding protein
MKLLTIEELVVRFGGVIALDEASLSVQKGSICGLIGPNGAGKTTLFNCVSRLYQPESGEIVFDGEDLLARAPHQIPELGIARTFQNLGLFASMSVRENVMLGAHSRTKPSFAGSSLRPRRTAARDRRLRDEASEVLARLGLEAIAAHRAAGLPYGTLKRVELARAVLQRPRLLMLDEPASGLNHAEVGALADLIRELRGDLDLTVLLVEHNMGMVMGLCDQVVVLDAGLSRSAGMSLLEVSGLRASYGQVTVLEGIDFSVEHGQKVAMLGPNGAGKTTVLRALSGMVRTSGRAEFDGDSLLRRPTAEIARRGVAHVPEGRGTFAPLSVTENLKLGAYARRDSGIGDDLERCYGWFPRLRERGRQPAGSLSGGEQQMLAVARALMSRPRLLMLDEPSLGLAPIVTRELFKVLGEICAEQEVTVLLVEQNARVALDFADHAYVLESGRIALSGEADRVKSDDEVRRSYLGV